MRYHWILAIIVIISVTVVPATRVQAQVVTERKSQANPASAIFRATLYGAGTGLVLGGAVALVEDDEDISTGDCLKWGVAGGAVAGAVIGLVYVLTRSEARGSADTISMLGSPGDSQYLALPSVSLTAETGPLGATSRTVNVHVLNVRL